MTNAEVFKDAAIDKEEADLRKGNPLPKGVVTLEKLFDLHNRFRGPPNTKTHSSTLLHEQINLNTESDPKYVNLGMGCTPEERQVFISLFRRYRDVFAWTYDDLKTYDTQIIQHVIPTKEGAKPFQQKLRKLHPALKPLIQKELKKLLDACIIFKVRHSRWVSNMVLVRKKSGEIHFCVDFRNLNRASDKDNYPIPCMEQILQTVSGSEVFSLLDGFSGYNLVLVVEPDWIKTTFRTKWGTFAFRRMSFRLINVKATFQRAMDIAFRGLMGQSVVVYLDDVTAFSKKRGDHLHHLKQIFERCWKYGISLHSKKSIFVVSEGNLLGHIITKNEITIDPDRIKAIAQIPQPSTKKDMKSFLGKINFLRKFISNFVQIVKPLRGSKVQN